MKRARMIAARLLALGRAPRLDADLDDEMRAHLEMLADEHQARGMSRADAEAAARRDFGGLVQTKEAYRDQRGLPFVDTLVQDLRYAARMTRRSPGFSVVVVLVLAIGIGVNSAMFTFVNALLFRPLPGRAGDLVGLYSHDPSEPNSYRRFSYANYLDIRDRNDVFEQVIAHVPALVAQPAGDVMHQLFAEIVSANYFPAMGVPLAMGRTFTPEEDRAGADIPVVIASYAAWQKAGLDPAFLGRTLRINRRDFTIVGVAPRGFTGTTAIIARDLWLPIGVFDSVVNDVFKNNHRQLADRSNNTLSVAGWLKPGVTMEQANARLARLSQDLERAYPAENHGQVLTVQRMSRVNMSSSPTSDTGPQIVSAVVMPLTGAVLLIACLNIANMLLARSTARKKEIAIRLALGGGRGRIVRQLLTESLLLAAVGAAAGLLIGSWTIRMFLVSLVPIMPIPIQIESTPDANIMLVTTVCAVLSALGFGLAPALKSTRLDLVDDLKDPGASHTPGRRFATRAWLVVCQIAVSLVLLTTGGLFARSALSAATADPGYSYDGLLLTSIDPSLAGYDAATGATRVRDAVDRVRQLPGVIAAGANSQVPFGDMHLSTSVARVGQSVLGGREPTYTMVTRDYFKAAGLPIVRGRDFTIGEERAPERRVAIIDEPLARRLFPGEDPIDQQIVLPNAERGAQTETPVPMTIVGIVPGIRDDLTERDPVAHLYVPLSTSYRGPLHIYTHVAANEADILPAIRRELRALDEHLPVVELRTMREFHERGLLLWVIRTAGRTLMGLGTLALLLAVVGVYGVKSYIVSQRTREIGIRLALGASPLDIGWMLLRDGARTTLVGLAIGFPLAVVLGRLLSAAMYGVSPYDPLVLTLSPLVLALAAGIATYIPARRATRVTPLDALRTE